MKKLIYALLSCSLLMSLALMPAFAQTDATLQGNITEGCVTDYDGNVDYFPDKVEIVDADGFSTEYHNNYKVISVTNAFNEAPFLNMC